MSNTLDENKIAFIVCTNDDVKMAECDLYIDSLHIPNGMTTEKCYIKEAPSMAAGYNAGMQSSDAKYKVYLHQDVFLIDKDLPKKMVSIFRSAPDLGLLGVVGCINDAPDGHYVGAWDYGAVLASTGSYNLKMDIKNGYTPVAALDGLLLITQYDLPWREDLFTGWDFYDVSQSMEFRRRGYKVGVVDQDPESPWAFHDTEASSLERYYDSRKILRDNYRDVFPFSDDLREEDAARKTRDATMSDFYIMLCSLMGTNDGRTNAVNLLKEYARTIWGHANLNRLRKAGMIHREESAANVPEDKLFWQSSDNADDLLNKVQTLTYAIKRVEFGVDPSMLVQMLSDGELSSTALSTASVLMVNKWEDYLRSLEMICQKPDIQIDFHSQKSSMKALMERIFAEDPDGVY